MLDVLPLSLGAVSAASTETVSLTYALVDAVPRPLRRGVKSPVAACQYGHPGARDPADTTYNCMAKAETKTVPSMVTFLRRKVLQSGVSYARSFGLRETRL